MAANWQSIPGATPQKKPAGTFNKRLKYKTRTWADSKKNPPMLFNRNFIWVSTPTCMIIPRP